MEKPIHIPVRPRSVLVVTPYYAGHGGSIERIAQQLIHDISLHANFHFTWAASDCATSQPHNSGMTESKQLLLLPMRALNQLERFFGLHWPIWTRRSLRQLRRAVEGVDCVWLHDTFSLGSLIAFILAYQQGKPILITKHSGPTEHPNIVQRSMANMLDYLVTRKILGKAQQATFTADAAAEFYYRKIGFTAPVKIIPNGVDRTIFHMARADERQHLRARFALRKDQPVLLFVGRFTQDNGLPVLKELAKLLPEWRFWLAGAGPVNPEKWFLPNVQVFRGRKDTDLAELYQSADLLLQPGYQQGFPLAAQEAMACGLPLMCGPATAASSDFAKPYLWVAQVDPASPKQTAALWAAKLKAGSAIMPLAEAKSELSELAESYWEWPKIAGYYAETLHAVCKSKVA